MDDSSCRLSRLIECVTRGWEPILCEVPGTEGAYCTYPALVSKLGNSWRVVR